MLSSEKPRISIITATLNRKDYLPRCIQGVALQSYPNKEHVIIDGGSTDGTVDLLKSYAEQYPHITWRSGKDKGISDALNKGLAIATGDIFGVSGDDDFYEPGAFEIVAAEFEAQPSVGLVAGNTRNIRNDGTVWGIHQSGFTNRRDLIKYWANWGRTCFLPAQSSFFHKRVVDAVGGFDEADRFAMDYHHWIKITEKFEVKIIDSVLANFRYDEGTVTFTDTKKQFSEIDAISRRYWGSISTIGYYAMVFSYFRYYKLDPFTERIRNSFKYRVGRLFGNGSVLPPDPSQESASRKATDGNGT